MINATTGTTLHCKANGSGSLTYQWEYNHLDERQWRQIHGSNGEYLVVRNLPYSEKYRCIVTNKAGRTISDTATVFLLGKLLINSSGIILRYVYNRDYQSASQSCNCFSIGKCCFNFLASVDDVKYSWHRVHGSVPPRSIGQDNSTLTIPRVIPYDAGVYYCIAKKDEITVESNKARLTVDGKN